jgi:hypothetical protein
VAATLKDILLAPERRELVVADLQALVDTEVSSVSGMSGFAVKGSYAVVKKFKSGFVPHAINQMLPEFAHKLQPYYSQYDPARDGSLSSYLVANNSAISDVLLQVADGRARKSGHETVKKAYQKLRPQAKKHVEHALPALTRELSEGDELIVVDNASTDGSAARARELAPQATVIEAGANLGYGAFGENLTTEGLIETDLCPGDILEIGTAAFAVTIPRMPATSSSCGSIASTW